MGEMDVRRSGFSDKRNEADIREAFDNHLIELVINRCMAGCRLVVITISVQDRTRDIEVQTVGLGICAVFTFEQFVACRAAESHDKINGVGRIYLVRELKQVAERSSDISGCDLGRCHCINAVKKIFGFGALGIADCIKKMQQKPSADLRGHKRQDLQGNGDGLEPLAFDDR